MPVESVLTVLAGVPPSQTADSIPSDTGAYLIAITLDHVLSLPQAMLRSQTIGPGTYLYAGSAKGPGGLRARIARHLRPAKVMRWHVDHLTTAAAALTAYPVPGGSECDLVDTLLASGRFDTPLPGFGSSDCRHCASHLLRWIGD